MKTKTKKKYTLEDLIKNLELNNKKQKTDSHAYGEVKSINQDGTYNVSLNGSQTTVKCARLCGAEVGDTVYVTIMKNGFSVVTDCLGGDKDALRAKQEADATSSYFWYKNGTGSEAGAHVTEIPKDDFEETPTGGNIFMKSAGIYLRRGLTVFMSILSTVIKIGPTDVFHLAIGPSYLKFNNGGTTYGTVTVNEDRLIEYYGDDRDNCGELSLWDDSAFLTSRKEMENSHGDTVYFNGYCRADTDDEGSADAYVEARRTIGDSTKKVGYYAEVGMSGTSTANIKTDKLHINDLPMFATFEATGTVARIVAAQEATCTLTGTVPDGYTPIAVQTLTSNEKENICLCAWELTANGVTADVRNEWMSTVNNVQMTAEILCVATPATL